MAVWIWEGISDPTPLMDVLPVAEIFPPPIIVDDDVDEGTLILAKFSLT